MPGISTQSDDQTDLYYNGEDEDLFNDDAEEGANIINEPYEPIMEEWAEVGGEGGGGAVMFDEGGELVDDEGYEDNYDRGIRNISDGKTKKNKAIIERINNYNNNIRRTRNKYEIVVYYVNRIMQNYNYYKYYVYGPQNANAPIIERPPPARKPNKPESNIGKFKDKFYKRLSGSFFFQHTGNKTAEVRFVMNNVETELFFGMLLSEKPEWKRKIDKSKVPPAMVDIFNRLDAQGYLLPSLQGVYIDSLKYLTQIGSASRKTPKFIYDYNNFKLLKYDTKDYKKYYGMIKLKKVVFKDVSKYLTKQYNINDNCVFDYFTENLDKKFKTNIKSVLGYSVDPILGLTYVEILQVARHYNFSCIARDNMYEIIAEHKRDDSKKINKSLDFQVYNDHMHVLDKQRARQDINIDNELVIDTLDSIYKYTYSNLIVTEKELYDDINDYISNNYVKNDYSGKHICFKTNTILYKPFYVKDKNTLDSFKSKHNNVYSFIESKCQLKGYINEESYKYFPETKKIRYLNYEKKPVNIQFDCNKTYPFILRDTTIVFPVPSISDYWIKYDKQKITLYGFYYCELSKYDDILGLGDGIYCGYEVEILKKEKRIKKITCMFISSNVRILDKDDLKHFDNDQTRRYIGWLMKSVSVTTNLFDDVTEYEFKGLQGKHKCAATHDKGTLTISKTYLVKKTGMLTNMLIKGITNIKLYEFNKMFLKKNSDATLVYIRTDSLGYYLKNNKYEVDKKCVSQEEHGKFKIEKCDNLLTKYENPLIMTILTGGVDLEPIYNHDNTINDYERKDVIKLIESKQCFQLRGSAGYGKSHMLNNEIIPYFKKNNIEYIVCGTTNESAKNVNGVTIQSLFTKVSLYLIREKFSDIKYLIVDESSQITQALYKYLEYVKKNTGCKIILMGDQYQCKALDAKQSSWLITPFVNKLCDNNVIELKAHTKMRYDNKLNEHLNNIKYMFNDRRKVIEYVKVNFKCDKITKNNYNIAFYNSTCDKVIKQKNKCITVHCVQGLTIDNDYSVHDINNMTTDVIYTALSRAKSTEQITIILK